jgi:hypothetical protein
VVAGILAQIVAQIVGWKRSAKKIELDALDGEVNGETIEGRRLRSRLGIWSVLIAGAIFSSACSGLVKSEDVTIPHLLLPIAQAPVEELTAQLAPFLAIDSLRATGVYLRFDDLESAQRYRDAEAALALQRPDKIRLIITVPVVKTRIAEMVSEENRFRVAVYPSDFRRFLIGTNTANYASWRERLGERGQSALIAARPFHFTDALLIKPLRLNDPGYRYSLEEALLEEADPDPAAKKGARILRSYYVLAEIEEGMAGSSTGKVTRRFWFDRTRQMLFSRQQIFGTSGQLETDVTYSAYRPLNASGPTRWPTAILVSRPYDNYQARILFSFDRLETNIPLPASAFQLENTEGLPETDLDQPLPEKPGPTVPRSPVNSGRGS